jgi:uncharacterized phiE125 gp8 family phage protein
MLESYNNGETYFTRKTFPTITTSHQLFLDAKTHLNIYSDTSQDSYILQLVKASLSLTEKYLGEYLFDTTVEFYIPELKSTVLPHKGAKSITSVKYIDSSDIEQTWDSSNYYLEDRTEHKSLKVTDGATLPTDISTTRDNPIMVTYQTNYWDYLVGDSSTEAEDLRIAVLMYVGEIFSGRDNTSSKGISRLPLCSERLLTPYKRIVL